MTLPGSGPVGRVGRNRALSNITLRQMEYFIAIVEEGNLAGAAARLHVTSGTISTAISALEKELGVRVLTRIRAKGTTVSADGRALEPQIRDALSAIRSVETAAGSLRSELSGTLALGCFDTLAPWLLPPLLGHFAERHKSVTVEPMEAPSDILQQHVRAGRLDGAFVYHRHLDGDLDTETVMPVRLQVVLPADHRLAHRQSVKLAELADDPAILLGLHPAAETVRAIMADAGLEPNVRWELRNPDVIRSLVGRGLGYSVLMGRPQGDQAFDGAPLAYCRIADDMPTNSVELVFRRGRRTEAKVKELIRFATGELRRAGGPMQTGISD